MAAAREAMDCSMRAWLALPIALPSAAAAAFAACRDEMTRISPHCNARLCRVGQQHTEQLLPQAHKPMVLLLVTSAIFVVGYGCWLRPHAGQHRCRGCKRDAHPL